MEKRGLERCELGLLEVLMAAGEDAKYRSETGWAYDGDCVVVSLVEANETHVKLQREHTAYGGSKRTDQRTTIVEECTIPWEVVRNSKRLCGEDKIDLMGSWTPVSKEISREEVVDGRGVKTVRIVSERQEYP